MTRPFAFGAFATGLGAIVWIAVGYGGGQPVALGVCLLMAVAYVAAGLELQGFAGDSARLRAALQPPVDPPALDAWLARLPDTLQPAVQRRIDGERAALPGPVMTPFVVGLLVLLGMLGTFIGMVFTLKGAVLALDATRDLAAIRAALTEPVRGLGVAFGSSVAGVAGSAMLGLSAALLRRERLRLGQRLDACIAAGLYRFGQPHRHAQAEAAQQQALVQALERQAAVLPQVLGQLQATLDRMAQQHDGLAAGLVEAQARFHAEAEASARTLAMSLERSLADSLVGSAEAAAAAIQPAVAATMQGLAEQGGRVQQQLAAAVQAELQGLSARFEATLQPLARGWGEGLAAQQQAQAAQAAQLDAALAGLLGRVEAHTTGLARAIGAAHDRQLAQAAAADAVRLADWRAALEAIAVQLQARWQRAGEQAAAQQQQICQALADTARGLQAEAEAQSGRLLGQLTRLIDAASEAPRSASELVAQLRSQVADGLVRDNAMLDERARLVASLGSLLDTLNAAATEQRAAIEGLVASSAGALQQVGAQFAQAVESGSGRLAESALQVAGGAAEVASLGEAFGAAVEQFGAASEAMAGQLQRIEAALDHAAQRSDEQLGYYVAQAREIIDLSIASQQQIVDDLRRLAERPLATAA